jgi:hypothetical protein
MLLGLKAISAMATWLIEPDLERLKHFLTFWSETVNIQDEQVGAPTAPSDVIWKTCGVTNVL